MLQTCTDETESVSGRDVCYPPVIRPVAGPLEAPGGPPGGRELAQDCLHVARQPLLAGNAQ